MIVDLHIHSHYSRATSPLMNISSLYTWGKIKGIDVIGTGDFTHPAWFAELKEKLEPAEPGLFKLKTKYQKKEDSRLPSLYNKKNMRFLLTVEISNIYKRGGKVRKLHNLVIAPSMDVVQKINRKLGQIGNLKADGRPILGMDSKDLLKVTLDADPDAFFIPAHIWTPWFAMFGSKSGFDSLEDAFGDLASEIKAIETGLSSDPFMNWRVGNLDGLTLVSNSDAHSPSKLGREANVINAELSYKDILSAVKSNDERFVGTIEFFPQEGKYHHDGHKKCGISMAPSKTRKLKGICPKCKKPLVLGVFYRVSELSDKDVNFRPKNHKSVEYIIPLEEIIAETVGVKSTKSKKVQEIYTKIYNQIGDEFSVLRNIDTKEISALGYPLVAKAVEKLRAGDVFIKPGYDGVYGTVQIFTPEEKDKLSGQMKLL